MSGSPVQVATQYKLAKLLYKTCYSISTRVSIKSFKNPGMASKIA